MIGLIGAMQLEIEQLEKQIADRRETRIGLDAFVSGTLFGREAVLAVCGPGKVNAALCAQSMILHFHPEWILNLGVAGSGEAVQHDMDTSPIGDPVGFISKVGLVELPCDAALRRALRIAAAAGPEAKVHEGIIATGDQFINKPEVRSRIHARFGAKAVEMEGAAVAHACFVQGVPCGVLRSISDNANGGGEMDYAAFAQMAAERTHRVVRALLEGVSA